MLGECRITSAAIALTIECHIGVRTDCIPAVLMVFATVVGHDRAAEAEKEGKGKADHCPD
jgi:hypothetical protein